MSDESNQPAITDEVGLEQIFHAVRYVERLSKTTVPQSTRRTPPFSIRTAKVTVAITARSGTTAGTGKADLYYHEGRTLIAESPAINVDVYNDYGVSIAINTYIKVYPEGGAWNLLSADCP